MAHAVASLEKALAAGERFVYISNHPAAISFRRAISDFCRLICTECKRDNDTGYQAGPQNKKVPFLFVGLRGDRSRGRRRLRQARALSLRRWFRDSLRRERGQAKTKRALALPGSGSP